MAATILQQAHALVGVGLKAKDALRIACAIAGECPYFVTTDDAILIRALVVALGTLEAERFITLMLREPFDYTSWQRHLWAEKSVDELSKAAMALRSAAPNKGMEPTP